MKSLWFEAAVCEEDEMWFVSGIGAGLFKINLKDSQIKYINKIPIEDGSGIRLLTTLAKVENKIIGAPFMGSTFWNYDINKNIFQTLSDVKNMNTFYTSIKTDTSVFFIARDYVRIAEYNSIRNDIQMYDFEDKRPEIKHEIGEDIFFTGNGIIYDNKIYVAVYLSNYIFEFDLRVKTSKFIEIKGAENDFFCLTIHNDDFLIATAGKAKIYKWDYITGFLKTITEFPEEFIENEQIDFLQFIKSTSDILLYPANSNMILNFNDDSIKRVGNILNDFGNNGTGAYYCAVQANNNDVYALRAIDNVLVKYNSDLGILENVNLIYSKKEIMRYEKDIFYTQPRKQIIMEEETSLGLQGFIQYVVSEYDHYVTKNLQNSGQLIVEEIMKKLN